MFEHKKLGGLLQPLEILEWKWDMISMDLLRDYPLLSSGMILYGWLLTNWLDQSISFPYDSLIRWKSWKRSTLERLWNYMGYLGILHHKESVSLLPTSVGPSRKASMRDVVSIIHSIPRQMGRRSRIIRLLRICSKLVFYSFAVAGRIICLL